MFNNYFEIIYMIYLIFDVSKNINLEIKKESLHFNLNTLFTY